MVPLSSFTGPHECYHEPFLPLSHTGYLTRAKWGYNIPCTLFDPFTVLYSLVILHGCLGLFFLPPTLRSFVLASQASHKIGARLWIPNRSRHWYPSITLSTIFLVVCSPPRHVFSRNPTPCISRPVISIFFVSWLGLPPLTYEDLVRFSWFWLLLWLNDIVRSSSRACYSECGVLAEGWYRWFGSTLFHLVFRLHLLTFPFSFLFPYYCSTLSLKQWIVIQ